MIDFRLGGCRVASCEGSEVRPVLASVVRAHSRAISDWLIFIISSNVTTVVDGGIVTAGKELTDG